MEHNTEMDEAEFAAGDIESSLTPTVADGKPGTRKLAHGKLGKLGKLGTRKLDTRQSRRTRRTLLSANSANSALGNFDTRKTCTRKLGPWQ